MTWFPELPFSEGPRYLQIVAALQADLAAGTVAPGQRLPTHREMADRLKLSVGTVSKAYAAAEKRGLISGEVGRGTFVLPAGPELGVAESSPADGPRRINLALNAPPRTGEDEVLARTLSAIVADPRLPDLISYLPHQGREDHRRTMAEWLTEAVPPAGARDLFITHGAQHAISIAMRLIHRPGVPILAENLTYSGIMALSLMEGYTLRGVFMDGNGILPERLDQAFTETGARALYCTPTLQTATASLMPLERRREIAEIVHRHDAYLIEDDAYGFLCDEPLPTLSSLLPERSFYIVSFAKCLAPGLRIGTMIAPPRYRDRVVNAIRATGWMANAVMAEAVVRMIREGSLADQIVRKRVAAFERSRLAYDILGDFLAPASEVPAFHLWLSLSVGRTATSLASEAAQAGIVLSSPSALQPFDPMGIGLRLCLGGASELSELGDALTTLRGVLSDFEAMATV